ncbi:MAG: hypothetical protein QE485_10670 [Acidovorax sp.]|uniref:LexA family protein n=1 Tax=Acidovorax sp. TaxID=1872122 RepID=UPI0026198197|nr:hypothetical protein [Acidovorax sp.]MDH4417678.1 hypothetical protein [Acidovorax sp.]
MTEANAIAAQLRGQTTARRGKAKGPSAKSLDVLQFCREFFAENDQLPPIACVNAHFGWSSSNAAQHHMDMLVRHGRLERNAVGKLRFARGGAAC